MKFLGCPSPPSAKLILPLDPLLYSWKITSLVRDIAAAIMPDGNATRLRVQASAPLQFVPWDASCETDLAQKIGGGDGNVIAFAAQKVTEVVKLAGSVPGVAAGKTVRFVIR